MYLVLIAMLALNMSKEVLTAFGIMNNTFEESNLNAAEKNTNFLANLAQKAADEPQQQPAVDSIAATKKYSEQMSLAAGQMESLNSLYKVQMESAARQAEANKMAADNAEGLKSQMESLTSNLSSLNGVYGGMLSAMTNK